MELCIASIHKLLSSFSEYNKSVSLKQIIRNNPQLRTDSILHLFNGKTQHTVKEFSGSPLQYNKISFKRTKYLLYTELPRLETLINDPCLINFLPGFTKLIGFIIHF